MADIDVLVTGGRLYLDGEIFEASLCVSDGVITHVTTTPGTLSADETVELDGELVLPGLVDGHVHFREPGYEQKEGAASGTAAAAAGGVTTVVEMPNTTPPVLDREGFREKRELFESKSHVDFALFGAITAENLDTGAIAALAEEGATAFKTFMATSFGPLLMDDKGELYRAFEEVAETGRPIYIHAEDQEYLTEFTRRANELGEDLDAFFASRPPVVERTAIADVIEIVRETGAETVVAHVTTAEGLEMIAKARAEGLPIRSEVTSYHLRVDESRLRDVGTRGIGTPPVRTAANREALWQHFENDQVDLLGSDHAPHTLDEKDREPLAVAPGMPQLETALGALLDAVHAGRTTLPAVVRRYAERPARVHGLYPRKGTLQVGADADFVVVDPEREWTVDATAFESEGKYSPFDGWQFTGMPVEVYQRGRKIAEELETLNEPGDGTWVH